MRSFSCLKHVDAKVAKSLINDASLKIHLTQKKLRVNTEGHTHVEFSRIVGSYAEYQATLRNEEDEILALAIV